MNKPDHAGHVASWMERAGAGASLPESIVLFEAAFNALWRRAEGAVGGVALESITEVIRAKAAEGYPFLSPLALSENGLSCRGLTESAGGLKEGPLRESLGFMLAELLQVIGELTDEVLTPALYDALDKVGPAGGARPPAGPAVEEAREEKTPMTSRFEFISTGLPNFDEILGGGLIKGSSTALVGPPGSGKTILAQQIAFHNASPKHPVLYFSTLSEPGAKTLFYLKKFDYYEPKKLDESIHFVDLGVLLRAKGLPQTLEIIFDRMRKLEPALVVVDSIKIFEDLAPNPEALRKFTYELVLKFMTRKCTALFLGEYAVSDYERSPLFSIIDGLVTMSQRTQSGEEQRFIKLVKMRGLAHSRNEHSFRITESGVSIFAPRLTIKPAAPAPREGRTPLCVTGIPKLDELLGGGIPRGSSLLLSGVAGTGKTVLGLEFIYRGALAGEKGIVFSFEETDRRLRAAAAGLGWDLEAHLASGMIEIVFIPQPDILVEQHLLMMQERIEKLGAARVVVDSLSVFLHKVKEPQAAREKVFQLASVVQNSQAVGFFATDIPYGEARISRFGVEETVVDGVIILSSEEEGLERQRYIEVYKLRNTAHLKGRHTMVIDKGGILIYPRYRPQELDKTSYPPSQSVPRLSTGSGALDALFGGGLLARSITLVSGSSGIGKSILGLQFLLAGAARKEHGLYVTLEEGPEELLANAAALDLPLKKAVDDGLIEIVYLPPTHTRSTQVIAVLTDKIKTQKTKRMVLDSTTHLVASSMRQDDVRELLYDLVVRFKTQGVTCYFTLEADSMYSTDFSADRGYTPLADNILVLRYSPAGPKVDSSLMVVKTRGSAHDQGLYSFTLGKGGLTLGGPLSIAPASQQTRAVAGGRKH